MAQHCLFVVASVAVFLAFLAVGVGFFAPFWLGNVTRPAPGSGGGANIEDPTKPYLDTNLTSAVIRHADYHWRGLWAQCSTRCQWFWTNDFQLQKMKFNELSESRRAKLSGFYAGARPGYYVWGGLEPRSSRAYFGVWGRTPNGGSGGTAPGGGQGGKAPPP